MGTVTVTRGVDRTMFAHAALVVLEEEIRERARWERGWFRHGLGRNWPDLRAENRLILRVLFRIRRKARGR